MARILVIDDSPLVIQFVRGALGADGHEIVALTSFVHLAAHVRDAPPDLILLDLSIPALSGVSIGQLIRKHQTRALPILVYSSRDDRELATAVQTLDAIGYVRKTRSGDDLRAAVTRALAAVQKAAAR